MSQGRFKKCPKCGATAALQAPRCLVCNHTFRTRFDADGNVIGPDEKPEITPAPIRPYVQPADGGALPPAPLTLQAPPPPSDFREAVLYEEISRQYRSLGGWLLAGAWVLLQGPLIFFIVWASGLFLPLMMVGILFPILVALCPLIALGGGVYALMRRPQLRQRVAELGIDASWWARYHDQTYRKVLLWVILAPFGFLAIVSIIILFTVKATNQFGVR